MRAKEEKMHRAREDEAAETAVTAGLFTVQPATARARLKCGKN